jgi:hypothetical protein
MGDLARAEFQSGICKSLASPSQLDSYQAKRNNANNNILIIIDFDYMMDFAIRRRDRGTLLPAMMPPNLFYDFPYPLLSEGVSLPM